MEIERNEIMDSMAQAIYDDWFGSIFTKTLCKAKNRNHLMKALAEAEYSEFIRIEIVVNVATHRDYGIMGTDIQIKRFDDRLEVDSP